ncbi:MAG: invasion associated locus B family protein [Octadecabacter sp.]
MTFLTSRISKTLSVAALACALGAPTFAQEATQEPTDEPQVETPTQTAEEQPESVFNMGEEVDENGDPVAAEPQEPQPGQQYLSEVHGDWALRCLKVEEGEDPCQMYQLLNDADGNAVAEIAIVVLQNGGQAVAGATIVAPLETLLTEQLTLRVDGGQARRFPFNFCNVGGCVTRLGLTEQDVALFRRGAEATLRMVPAAAPDQDVTVTMSLSGFTAAFNAAAE